MVYHKKPFYLKITGDWHGPKCKMILEGLIGLTYTRIVTYDIASGDRRYVTFKSKYFFPHFSSKGDKIIVVKADENIQNKLMVINAID